MTTFAAPRRRRAPGLDAARPWGRQSESAEAASRAAALEADAIATERDVLATGGRGLDLSAVRIHTDAEAAGRARALGAAAFTIGDDVYFAAGRFRPDSRAGRGLIAHELAHVVQQRQDGRLRLQLAPDTPERQEKSVTRTASGDLELPWSHGDYTLFELTSSGIRFLVALGTDQEKAVRTAIPALARQIASDNTRISPAAGRVMTCFITPATTRFARWQGIPVLILDPSDATVATVAHEMGHATFDALAKAAAPGGAASTAQATSAQAIRLRVADLFLRLRATRPPPGGESAIPVGLMMVDPSEWSPGMKSEHPSSDADEFFASAKEAYQVNPAGLRSSIARAARADPAVGPLGRELLALLAAVYGRGSMPRGALPSDRAEAAAAALTGLDRVSNIEDSTSIYPLLSWLLDPSTRPGSQKQ